MCRALEHLFESIFVSKFIAVDRTLPVEERGCIRFGTSFQEYCLTISLRAYTLLTTIKVYRCPHI